MKFYTNINFKVIKFTTREKRRKQICFDLTGLWILILFSFIFFLINRLFCTSLYNTIMSKCLNVKYCSRSFYMYFYLFILSWLWYTYAYVYPYHISKCMVPNDKTIQMCLDILNFVRKQSHEYTELLLRIILK